MDTVDADQDVKHQGTPMIPLLDSPTLMPPGYAAPPIIYVAGRVVNPPILAVICSSILDI